MPSSCPGHQLPQSHLFTSDAFRTHTMQNRRPCFLTKARAHWPAGPEHESQHVFTCWLITRGVLANEAGGGASRSVCWGAGQGRNGLVTYTEGQ